MLQREYARAAFKLGLKLEQKLGVNPYKFGMVGSTDAHTGSRRRRRGQFLRQDLRSEPSAGPRMTHPFVKTDKADDLRVGDERIGLRRGLGE